MQTLTFSEQTRNVGDSDPVYLCKVDHVQFSGEIVTDSANPLSPVLAHDTTYLGPVSIRFSEPVSHLDFTLGYFDNRRSTVVRVLDSNGHILKKATNHGLGIVSFSFDYADIARVNIKSESKEESGFALDTVRFVNQAPKVHLAHDRDIDGLLWGFKWDHKHLTYSFPASADEYLRNGYKEIQHFSHLSATQKAAYQQIIKMYDGVCGLSFSQTHAPNADIRFAQARRINDWDSNHLHAPGLDPGTAEALAPDPNHSPVSWGDVWLSTNPRGNDNSNPEPGNFTFAAAFMHELGHALGLKHGHATQNAHGVTFPKLPPDHDSQEYSIMTYSNYPGHETNTQEYPSTLMQDDIAALQYLYGADYDYRSGKTVYRWDPNTGEEFVNGVGQGATFHHKIFMTVWDGGGNDTYDFSQWRTDVTIDLRPGEWSKVSNAQLADLGDGHSARGNIANALLYHHNNHSLIENAYGGGGDDTLVGNAAPNLLKGDIGKDKLFGLGGTDELDGGGGRDILDGGADTDAFVYKAAAASHGVKFDTIQHFDATEDVLSLWFDVTRVQHSIVGGTLRSAHFASDMEAAVDQLGNHHAVLFTPDHGNWAGRTFLLVDVNGVRGYQSGPDLIIELHLMTHAGQFGLDNFI